jgi:hypothetical protein
MIEYALMCFAHIHTRHREDCYETPVEERYVVEPHPWPFQR